MQRKSPRITSETFVIPLGLEPKTHSLEGCCSIQLSYGTSLRFAAAKVDIFLITAKKSLINLIGGVSFQKVSWNVFQTLNLI